MQNIEVGNKPTYATNSGKKGTLPDLDEPVDVEHQRLEDSLTDVFEPVGIEDGTSEQDHDHSSNLEVGSRTHFVSTKTIDTRLHL